MIPAEQTAADHVREVAAVRASLLLPDTRAERHGVYPRRRPKGILPGPHTFAFPTVHELLPCDERRPL